MVMSEEPDMVGKEVDTVSEEKGKKRVSDKEKDLAGEASSAFNSGDYTGCLTTLEKLEVSLDYFLFSPPTIFIRY